jgi:hypothetical protein
MSKFVSMGKLYKYPLLNQLIDDHHDNTNQSHGYDSTHSEISNSRSDCDEFIESQI